ncbi:MBL fold metallo-hydrolase [Pontimicrobium aquaticum]|uniref:MBL fold metallo-hydrolase n=1 Tax=Pontimicrobium aquaticum TaxID=2565367 RepID=A0A4U0ES45_9FLAO|nr:MBL fold metallo-hydrolase [Pontimicrobium aquaticum]TJY34586.1 MBL fold metallo-hydrolase [Pontimicrobium aquaticum]
MTLILNKSLLFKNNLGILIIGLLLFSCNNKGSKTEKFTKKEIRSETFNTIRITENIYSIVSPSFGLPTPENKGWNSNAHFIVTKNGVLLFDTGSSESIGHKIKKTIATVTDLPVRWVVNSHSHADHWLGNAAFSDAEIIASNQAMKTMQKYGQDDVAFYAKVTNGKIGSTRLVYPNLLLNESQKRDFGGVKVEFIFADNGHSPGDVLMWLPKQRIVFGGDVLSSDWMPIITDDVNIPSLINTLNFIAELNPTKVLTGHGNATTVKSIERDVFLLSSVWEQVKHDYKNGGKPEETLLKIKTELKPEYTFLYKNYTAEIERYIKLMYSLQN